MSAPAIDDTQPKADDVLARLRAGNERFTRGQAQVLTVPRETLANAARGQRPYATIIGCSDSRVPPELIFDAPFGELFVIRVAGNVVSPEIMGTLQYGTLHLQTPLVLVLGHSGCGAIQAASDRHWKGAAQPDRIKRLLERITPGLPGRDRRADRCGGRSERSLVDRAVDADTGSAGSPRRRCDQTRRRRLRAHERQGQVPDRSVTNRFTSGGQAPTARRFSGITEGWNSVQRHFTPHLR